MTKQYVDDFLGGIQRERNRSKTGCIVFIGGGAKLLREYLENTDKIGKCAFCRGYLCECEKDTKYCIRCRKKSGR